MIARLTRGRRERDGTVNRVSQDMHTAPRQAADGAARRPGRPVAWGLLALAVAAAAGSSAYLLTRYSGPAAGQELRPSGAPAGMSTSLANLMNLDPLPRSPAPGFTLTDQAGRTMSLASLRGKVVVLEFMDPHCTDICPIVSQEFVDAYHDLGPAGRHVVFAAVNVNQYYRSVHAVNQFSQAHQLNTIPGWHFFTGPTRLLRTAWRDYNISVRAPNPNADIIHTSAVYVIDARGRERFLASPEVDHTISGKSYLPATQLAAWGRGIAILARSATR
jgi:protein SCO1